MKINYIKSCFIIILFVISSCTADEQDFNNDVNPNLGKIESLSLVRIDPDKQDSIEIVYNYKIEYSKEGLIDSVYDLNSFKTMYVNYINDSLIHCYWQLNSNQVEWHVNYFDSVLNEIEIWIDGIYYDSYLPIYNNSGSIDTLLEINLQLIGNIKNYDFQFENENCISNKVSYNDVFGQGFGTPTYEHNGLINENHIPFQINYLTNSRESGLYDPLYFSGMLEIYAIPRNKNLVSKSGYWEYLYEYNNTGQLSLIEISKINDSEYYISTLTYY